MNDQTVRNALLFQTTMEVLRDASGPLKVQDVLREVSERVTLTPHWLERYRSGQARWDVGIRFFTGDAATLGWITKRGGWTITEAGIEALEALPNADDLYAELNRRYREIDQRRKQAQESLGEVQQFIARALDMVESGGWTAHDDIAVLAGTTASEVADFLASGKVKLANGYRVLNADGNIPAEGLLNAAYRSTDLRRRLEDEGLDFDLQGRAS